MCISFDTVCRQFVIQNYQMVFEKNHEASL